MASEDSVTLYLASLEQGSSGGCLCFVSASPTAGAVSPTARIHRSRNQRVKMRMTSFTITPSDSLEKFFLPVPKNLCSAGLVLSSKRRTPSTRRHNNDCTELEVKTAPKPPWASHDWINRQKRAVIYWLGWLILNCYSTVMIRKSNAWSTRDFLGYLLLLSCLVVNISGKLQPKSGRAANGPDPSRIKVWVTSPGKVPWTA